MERAGILNARLDALSRERRERGANDSLDSVVATFKVNDVGHGETPSFFVHATVRQYVSR
jgi:hypothetical protein